MGSRFGDWLGNHPFARNVFEISSGAAVGQLLVFAAMPLITRLYDPASFGVASAFLAFLALLTVCASLKYELAIPLPERNDHAINVTALSVLLVFAISMLAAVAAAVLHALGPDRFREFGNLYPFLWLFPIGVLWIGLYQVFSFWNVRIGAFKRIGLTKLTQNGGMVAIQVGLGFLSSGPLSLLAGNLFGLAGGCASLAAPFWKESRDETKAISSGGMTEMAARYGTFAVTNSIASLANYASAQVPRPWFAATFSWTVGGWFGLAYLMIAAPVGLLGTAVAQVYFAEASRLAREGPRELMKLYWGTARKLLYIGIVPCAILTVWGSFIFRLLFGPEWGSAGSYASLLAPRFLLELLGIPLSYTLIALDRAATKLVWDLSQCALILGGLCIASSLHWTAEESVALFSALSTLSYVALILCGDWSIRRHIRSYDTIRS
jgi:O-antigen/teichoic acid export membrane protein